jgi:hypothetical protein
MYLPVKCVRSVQKKRAITLLFELIYSKTRKLSIGEKNHRSQTGSIPFFFLEHAGSIPFLLIIGMITLPI